jgi:DNA-binding transcriptional MerR regulator
MKDGHTISQVAAKTGFTASALRFYENAGLITPDRTAAGYRIYSDRSIERIRFISRAKQLGLRLDEITELVALWDGDRCTPVAERLSKLVDAKIGEAQERIAELVGLVADLQRARASLSAADDEPCGDSCACQTDAATARVGLGLTAKPTAVDEPAIACTLPEDRSVQRVHDWRNVLARSISRCDVHNGVQLHFPPDAALGAEVAALAAAEQSCCSFFTFILQMDRTGTSLTVTAPTDASVFVDALFGASA